MGTNKWTIELASHFLSKKISRGEQKKTESNELVRITMLKESRKNSLRNWSVGQIAKLEANLVRLQGNLDRSRGINPSKRDQVWPGHAVNQAVETRPIGNFPPYYRIPRNSITPSSIERLKNNQMNRIRKDFKGRTIRRQIRSTLCKP